MHTLSRALPSLAVALLVLSSTPPPAAADDASSSGASSPDACVEPWPPVTEPEQGSKTPAPQPQATPQQPQALSRESFVVEAFRNADDVKSLDFLRAGLPAFVAERLAHAQPLRFVGPSTLLGPTPPASARWSLGGGFARARGDRVSVNVTVKDLGRKAVAASASRTGARGELPQLALAAALEAFAQALGERAPVPSATTTAAFSRDPYAFVLYARGVGAYTGLRAHDNGRETARKLLGRALRVDPTSAEIMRYLGAMELGSGTAERARGYWLGALAARPDYVTAVADLARLDREGKKPTAVERYEQWVTLDPDDVDARRTYGELLASAGDSVRAKQELERVLEHAPDDLEARRALVDVLAADGGGAALIANLEKIVRLDANSLSARVDLAAAYASAGRAADAEAAYDEVLRRKPRQPTVLKLAGDLAFARGDYGKAHAYFARAHALSPADPRPVFRLATIYYTTGNLDASERWFSEALLFPGMQGPAYASLGAISLRRGQPKEARWLLGRSLRRRPAQASTHFNLALALWDEGRPTEAMAELGNARQLAPDDAGIRFFSGVVALRLELLPEAEEAFRETLRLDPHHADAAHNLAILQSLRPRREAPPVDFSGQVARLGDDTP